MTRFIGYSQLSNFKTFKQPYNIPTLQHFNLYNNFPTPSSAQTTSPSIIFYFLSIVFFIVENICLLSIVSNKHNK